MRAGMATVQMSRSVSRSEDEQAMRTTVRSKPRKKPKRKMKRLGQATDEDQQLPVILVDRLNRSFSSIAAHIGHSGPGVGIA